MTSQALDPFGYWPAQRSRVRKLGGPDKAHDPNYVFHTSYVTVPPGPALAEITFANLVAESGLIAVRVFQHLPDGVPQVTEQGKITALLPTLAKTGRSIKVSFEALAGATYAVTGYVFGECEARADAITIELAPRSTVKDDPLRARSLFGRLRARRAAALARSDEPRLSWPVSQGFTAGQTREADYSRLTVDLPMHLTQEARWETAYIIRVLEQYGRLEPGARGLGFAMETDPVAAHVARAGCDGRSVLASPGEAIADACARQLPDADDRRGFDFVWSHSDVFGVGGSGRAIGFIEELLEHLRPGGLGIHLFSLDAEIDRDALNRIALGLAALGHIVAQLRPPPSDSGPIPFGIVVRKSTDDLIA